MASTEAGECSGSRGGSVDAERALEQVRTAQHAAVVFVGGGGAKLLYDDPEAHRIAREARELRIPLGAICLAPVILARAGVLRGVRATVAGTEAATLTANRAIYTGPGVTVDDGIVTANCPKSSSRFGHELADVVASRS